LVRERGELLDRDGYLWREPLIEPIPAYPVCGRDFRAVAHDTLDGPWGLHAADEFADFVACGAFSPDLQPYEHQRFAFEQSVARGRDVVVTTGTGSGKTECFVLPVLAALVRESTEWGAPGARSPQWDWWDDRHKYFQGQNIRYAQRVSQRAHEDQATRPAAVRALLLYPLNALVEDQLIRLREAMDSGPARAWLDARRRGNRFYFGRYTGRTPLSGDRTSTNTARLRAELREMDRDARLVASHPKARRFFPAMDGAEMWSRWDMQDAPPDLLITNYSMLNIMLMRNVEAGIFDATRRWLAADRRHLFHLVVDELHTYRGTPGTEVAYLLRVLLDRLGLAPDSDQLRIIASSASLESGDSGLAYLEGFFSRDRSRFEVVGGSLPRPDATAISAVRGQRTAFQKFARSLRNAGADLAAPAAALHRAVGCAAPPSDADAERRLNDVAERTRAAEALRAACLAPDGSRLLPRTPSQLCVALFGETLPEGERDEAAEGVLACLCAARSASGSAPLPLRSHLFFRNVQGLWACTNPECTEVSARAQPCPVGKLYYQPTLSCRCGSRVLELLSCECCGEVFLGGYRPLAPANPGEWCLSADHPDLEASPETAFLDRQFQSYAVFWPANGLRPITPQWVQDGVARRWDNAALDTREGKVVLGGSEGVKGFLYNMRNPTAEANQAYPAICPRCDEDRRRRRLDTSLRVIRTGFQKLAQVLSDALLRHMPQTAGRSNRKLVVFSDSRQDAAKLSAGMRFAHYRDALRQSLTEALKTAGRGTLAFRDQIAGLRLDQDRMRLAAQFVATHPTEANILNSAANSVLANLPAPGTDQLTYVQAAQRIIQRGEDGPFPIRQLTQDIAACLLSRGMNPGGYAQEVLWTDQTRKDPRDHWRELYAWNPTGQPATKAESALAPEQRSHVQRIESHAFAEVIDIVFASARRSLEALCIALATTDRLSFAAPSPLVQETADGVIQVLGSRRSRLSTHDANALQNIPTYVVAYIHAVARKNGVVPQTLERQVMDHLARCGVLSPGQPGVLVADALCFVRPGEQFFGCPQCRRVHLHRAGSVCVAANSEAVERTCDLLLTYADAKLRAERGALLDYVQTQLADEVTRVANDPRFTQDSLSERLANAGLLPMFGFPTRVRLLFHDDPNRARAWPPENAVDRDLDIAISQFAPGAETVKDGVVHTAAGVVHYRRAGRRVREEADPLGPRVPIGTCRRCQAVNLSPGSNTNTCGVCGQADPDFRIVQLAQPSGFRTLYDGGRDFDGVFEWTPRASRAKTDSGPLPMKQHLNSEFWSDVGDVCVVNDNGGRLFEFEKLQGESWVTRAAVDQIIAQRQEYRLPPPPPVRYAPNSPIDERALGSIKPTDLFVLGLRSVPAALNLDPCRVEARAALYSFGFLLRRAAADLLDINELELRVGLRVVRDAQGGVVGQVFLSDALENGAGYSSQFAAPAALEGLLRYVSDPTSRFCAPIVAANHADRCQTSCPDCLRDYSNLAWHNILDWRMALDLARLALDANAPVDFTSAHWQSLVRVSAPPYFQALDWTPTMLGDLPAARSGTRGEFIVHPLWADSHRAVLQARAEASTAGIATLTPRTLFDLVRRPFSRPLR
jgi:hypothetical protein